MTRDSATLPGSMSVEAAVAYFTTQAAHRSYPVIDPQGRLLGKRLVATAISLTKTQAPKCPPVPTTIAIAASMIMR